MPALQHFVVPVRVAMQVQAHLRGVRRFSLGQGMLVYPYVRRGGGSDLCIAAPRSDELYHVLRLYSVYRSARIHFCIYFTWVQVDVFIQVCTTSSTRLVLFLTFTLTHPSLLNNVLYFGHGISVARSFLRFPPPGVTVVMALAPFLFLSRFPLPQAESTGGSQV